MNAHDILIGGLRIGFESAHGLTQTYEELGGSSLHRMMDGSGAKQTHWSKVRTVIEGSGRIPPGLESLDYTGTIEIQCMAPMAVAHATSNVFTLPAARRSDWLPVGYAIKDGRLIRRGCTVVTNTATVETIAGAQGYQVLYWPRLTCYADKPRRSFDGRTATAGWVLTAEEA